jgi:hypothetical protein
MGLGNLDRADRAMSRQPATSPLGHVRTSSVLPKSKPNLNTIAQNYDTLADSNTVTARTLFDKIMSNFAKLKNGAPSDSFLSDVTEFISFANAVATAASKSNIAALKSAVAAAEK